VASPASENDFQVRVMASPTPGAGLAATVPHFFLDWVAKPLTSGKKQWVLTNIFCSSVLQLIHSFQVFLL
jgi:hypothetical protein